MITEDYVSFETAKLLKEKGFDEKCHMCWDEVTKTMESADEYATNSELLATYISAPTLQMAMKWLREVHGLFIGTVFQPECLFKEDKWFWKWNISDKGHKLTLVEFGESDTYEEACESAIKYCLENLV